MRPPRPRPSTLLRGTRETDLHVSITDMDVYPGTYAICGLHNIHVNYPDTGVSGRMLTWVSAKHTSVSVAGCCHGCQPNIHRCQ